MKKTVLTLAVLAAMLLTACAAGSPGTDPAPKTTASAEVSVSEEITESEEETTAETTAAPESSIPFSGQVIYDADGIRITSQGIRYTDEGLELDVLAENGSGTDYGFLMDISAVNGFMTAEYTDNVQIASGASDKLTLSVSEQQLNDQQINGVYSLEIRLSIHHEGEFYLQNEYVTVALPDAGEHLTDRGTLMYEENGIKVWFWEFYEDESGEISPMFCIENNRDEAVTVHPKSIFINGYDYNGDFLSYSIASNGMLDPGKRATLVPLLFRIEGYPRYADAGTIEIVFDVYDPYDGESIFVTDPIIMQIN